MFTSVNMRSANIYRNVEMQTSVTEASPHELVRMLFDAIFLALSTAKNAIVTGDIPVKGKAISRTIRLLDEGLKSGLDVVNGGELARNLEGLYDYCIITAAEANARNDVAKLDEIQKLLQPVADSWSQIKGQITIRT